MLKLNSITFKDEETCKIIDVNIDGSVTPMNIAPDEYVCASLYAGLIMGGGFNALLDFVRQKK